MLDLQGLERVLGHSELNLIGRNWLKYLLIGNQWLAERIIRVFYLRLLMVLSGSLLGVFL